MSRSFAELVARARVHGAKRLARALLGPVAGTIPARYIRSVQEVLCDPTVAAHVLGSWQRAPATVADYDFPPEFPPYFRRSKAFDAQFGYRLRDVLVSSRSGLIWLPDGRLLEESYGSLIRALGWGDVRPELLLPVADELAGPVVPFPATGYYHWLLEVLPAAVCALDAEPRARLLLPSRAPAYLEDAAHLLAPGRVVRSAAVARVGECVMAGVGPFSGFVPRADLDRLRDRFNSAATAGGPAVIYVSRSRDAKRALANEAAVEQAMRDRGAEVVYAQELRLAEQRRRFAAAEVVIGPHGAGLANLVWARQPRLLVEIFPATMFNDCYARLARSLGIEYRYVSARPVTGSAGTVDVAALLAETFTGTRTEYLPRIPAGFPDGPSTTAPCDSRHPPFEV